MDQPNTFSLPPAQKPHDRAIFVPAMDLYRVLRDRAEADLQTMRSQPSDEERAFLGGRAQVYGLFAHMVQDDSTPQELEAEVDAHLTKAAEEIERSGLAEYSRGRIAGLNAIRKLLRAAEASRPLQ